MSKPNSLDPLGSTAKRTPKPTTDSPTQEGSRAIALEVGTTGQALDRVIGKPQGTES